MVAKNDAIRLYVPNILSSTPLATPPTPWQFPAIGFSNPDYFKPKPILGSKGIYNQNLSLVG